MIADKVRMWNQKFNDSEKDYLLLCIPIIISVLIKLILFSLLWDSPINNDGTLYIKAAMQYAMGNFAEGIALYPMPAYPLLLALVHMVIPDWIVAGYFISFVSMVIVTIPLYYISKYLFGVKAGFFACIVYAILPRMNEWSMYISRDPLFALLLIFCIYFALKSIKEKKSLFFGLAFVFAWCATLIRIEGVVFIGFYFLVLIYFSIIDKENRPLFLLRSLIWMGLPLGIAILALLSTGVRGIAVNRFDNVFVELTSFFSGKFLIKPIEINQFLEKAVTKPPFFDGHYSFATICRHFMPVFYLFGIIQILLKILFPLSIIPLYFGFKNRAEVSDEHGHSGKFILWVCILYICLGYYFLIKYDFIATRYLIIPSFLFLPWIGHGLHGLYEKISFSSHKNKILFLVLIIVFAPTIKTFQLISSGDNTNTQAVRWLKDNDKIDKTQIVSNDYRLAFYIDLKAEEKSNWKTNYYYVKDKTLDIKGIEKFALEQNAQIIVLKMKTKYKDKIENFQLFDKINSFIDNKYTVLIYNKVL